MTRRNATARDLGLDVGSGRDRDLFGWFLASYLFGKPIQQAVAERTWRVLVDEHGLDSPRKLCRLSWQRLVDLLGEGHYVRFDESTAERLLSICRTLNEDYGGRMSRLLGGDAKDDAAELKRRLLAFKGVGPKTVEIFLREARRAISR